MSCAAELVIAGASAGLEQLYKSLNQGFEIATEGDCSAHNNWSGRQNANNVDLNRGFPTWDHLNLTYDQMKEMSEPEVKSGALRCSQIQILIADASSLMP